MKKTILCILNVLVICLLSIWGNKQVGEAKKVKIKKYTSVYVACDETYSLSQVAKINKKIAKLKWISSSKKVVVKKKKFYAKRPGKYRLVAKNKKRKYVIPIVAVEKYRKKDYSQVTYATIRSSSYSPTTRVKISDIYEVKLLCEKIMQSTYTFNFKATKKRPVGWSYQIQLFASDGRQIDEVLTGGTSDGRIYYSCQYPDIIEKYTTELYQKYYVVPTVTP